jgi:multidrug efflux pump subunit AcrB
LPELFSLLAVWTDVEYLQPGGTMLIGLVTKNGILIVEFANQLRDRENLK